METERMKKEICIECPAFPLPEFAVLWKAAHEKKQELLQAAAHDRNLQIIALEPVGSDDVMLFLNDIATSEGEKEAIFALTSAKFTVRRMLCLWIEGGIDLPSYAFRKLLLESEPANGGTDILLLGTNGLNTRTLISTM